jgi:hypothetical protein
MGHCGGAMWSSVLVGPVFINKKIFLIYILKREVKEKRGGRWKMMGQGRVVG